MVGWIVDVELWIQRSRSCAVSVEWWYMPWVPPELPLCPAQGSRQQGLVRRGCHGTTWCVDPCGEILVVQGCVRKLLSAFFYFGWHGLCVQLLQGSILGKGWCSLEEKLQISNSILSTCFVFITPGSFAPSTALFTFFSALVHAARPSSASVPLLPATGNRVSSEPGFHLTSVYG